MKLTIVFGTRPEAIKVAPIILAARRRTNLEIRVVSTGQHREMLMPILSLFDLRPDADLEVMTENQSLASLSARSFERVSNELETHRPEVVLVQGDTTTAMITALSAFYLRIPVGHVEAGLRTDDLDAPFPEEANRRIISQVARWHFAPTEQARRNLLRDGVPHLKGEIHCTGNTVIDALLIARERLAKRPQTATVVQQARQWKDAANNRQLILVTGHRRESFGGPLNALCDALKAIAKAHPDTLILYPVHRNPNVLKPVNNALQGIANIRLSDPLDYPDFIELMELSDLIITDSGGVQEEAPALGKPILVTRNTTERPEALATGLVKLVGTDRERIVREANAALLDNSERQPAFPYGDGKASERILDALEGKEVNEFTANR